MTLRIGWFTTARGPGSRAMYEAVTNAVAAHTLDAEFAFVFCNRDPGEDPVTDSFLRLVEGNGHTLVTRSSVSYRRAVGGHVSRPGEPLPPWRTEYDRAVETALAPHPFDVGVLAGYMLIFEREFVSRHVILNLHPALPGGPSGTWREVIRHLIRTRAGESGVMLHLAIPEVDAGPVVAYCRYSLDDAALAPFWAALPAEAEAGAMAPDDAALEATPLFAAIRERGVRHEAPLLVAALAEFASGRLRATGGTVLDASGAPARPANVTAVVEAALAAG
jgi:phosphoribosylglycinamide formyltransferase 1